MLGEVSAYAAVVVLLQGQGKALQHLVGQNNGLAASTTKTPAGGTMDAAQWMSEGKTAEEDCGHIPAQHPEQSVAPGPASTLPT